MLFFDPPTHFRVKPEVIGFTPLKAPTWIVFRLAYALPVKTGMLFLDPPTYFWFKPGVVGFIPSKALVWIFSAHTCMSEPNKLENNSYFSTLPLSSGLNRKLPVKEF